MPTNMRADEGVCVCATLHVHAYVCVHVLIVHMRVRVCISNLHVGSSFSTGWQSLSGVLFVVMHTDETWKRPLHVASSRLAIKTSSTCCCCCCPAAAAPAAAAPGAVAAAPKPWGASASAGAGKLILSMCPWVYTCLSACANACTNACACASVLRTCACVSGINEGVNMECGACKSVKEIAWLLRALNC